MELPTRRTGIWGWQLEREVLGGDKDVAVGCEITQKKESLPCAELRGTPRFKETPGKDN